MIYRLLHYVENFLDGNKKQELFWVCSKMIKNLITKLSIQAKTFKENLLWSFWHYVESVHVMLFDGKTVTI